MSKPQVSLIDPNFLLDMATVLEHGNKKYGIQNWTKVEDYSHVSCVDAIFRHLLSYISGDYDDYESGKSHLVHVAARAMMLNYFHNTNTGKNDVHYDKNIKKDCL